MLVNYIRKSKSTVAQYPLIDSSLLESFNAQIVKILHFL